MFPSLLPKNTWKKRREEVGPTGGVGVGVGDVESKLR